MIGTRKEALEHIPYIYYLVRFKRDTNKTEVQALINSESEANAFYLSFAKQLDLPIRLIDIGAQKIDGAILDTYEMIVAAFSVIEKANQIRFFKKTLLVANVSLEIVLGILFLTLSSIDVDFSV